MALTTVNSDGIKDDSIVNADIKSDAAIALSKLASTPAVLTGSTNNTICTVTAANTIQGESGLTYDGADLNISNNVPQLLLTDTNSNNSYGRVRGNGGHLILSADVNNATGSSIINFEIDGSEKARWDTSGRLLIGHTSSINSYGAESQLQVSGTGFANSSLAIRRDSADTGAGAIILSKSRGSQGGVTVVQSGDSLGSIVWCGADGGDVNPSAGLIQCVVDGTPGTNDMPGRLEFYTTADGAGGVTERMRLDSSGRLKINTNSAAATNEQVTIKGGGDCFISLRSDSHADGNDQQIRFMVGDAIGSSGNICSSISSEIIQTSSGTLKANLVISANRGDATTNRYIIYGDDSVDHEFKTKTAASLLKLHNSGNVEISDGNLVVASTHGIMFGGAAGAGGMTSQVLDDYEEGTYSFNESSISVSNYGMRYIKIGRMVYLTGRIVFGSSTDTGVLNMTGLPFSPDTDVSNSAQAGYIGESDIGSTPLAIVLETSTSAFRLRVDNQTALNRSQVSGDNIRFNMCYLAAT